jgi:hypothetical protein
MKRKWSGQVEGGLDRGSRTGAVLTSTAEDEHLSDSSEPIVVESAGVIPISESDLFPIDPSAHVNDREDEIGTKAQDLGQSQPELDLPERLHTEQREREEAEPEDEEVTPYGNLVAPKAEDGGEDVVFVGEDADEDEPIVPTDGYSEGLVDEPAGEGDECPARWVEGGEFSQGLHNG